MQLIGSVMATTYSRLRSVIIKRHGIRVASSNYKIIFDVAALYASTYDDWIIDRFLGISRKKKHWKPIRKILHSLVVGLSDSQRFVYSQALNQAHWLTSRSERPGDKLSISKTETFDLLFMAEEGCSCRKDECVYSTVLPDMWRPDTRYRRRRKTPQAPDEWETESESSLV